MIILLKLFYVSKVMVKICTTFSIGSYANSSGHGSLGDPGRVYFHSKNFNPVGSSIGLVPNGIYTHVAITFSPGFSFFYIDGQFSGTTLGNFSIPNDLTVTYTRLGFYNVQGSFNLDGKLDDVSIWSSMLTQSEIQDLMNCSSDGSESNLVASWNFNSGTGNTVSDQSLNSYDGSISGASWDTEIQNQSCQLINLNGCDSVAVLNLTISNSIHITDSITICEGSVTVGINIYDTTGIYIDTLQSINGCDSIITTVLDVINLNINQNDTTICFGDSVFYYLQVVVLGISMILILKAYSLISANMLLFLMTVHF